jgi:hypothetical protein
LKEKTTLVQSVKTAAAEEAAAKLAELILQNYRYYSCKKRYYFSCSS